MARIIGVDLPRDKHAVTSLTYIYGIGYSTSGKVLAKTGISEDIRVEDLTKGQVSAVRNKTNGVEVESDLCREVQLNIRRLMEIGCYRGIRHRRELPAREQCTRINVRIRKDPVCTIANKKKWDDRRK